MEELGLCQGCSRIDVAYIGNDLIGFEIKSDYDSLKRLSSQIEFYNAVFNKVFLVTTERHFSAAIKAVPNTWGIYLIRRENEKIKIRKVRPGKKNNLVSSSKLVQLLWKEEMLNLFNKLSIDQPFWGKTKNELYQILVDNFDLKFIQKLVSNTLKNRSNWRSVQELA